MSNKMILKKAEDFVTSKWSGGSTTELYIYPPQAVYREGNFKCRISSATVEVEKSDFTSLPGVKRYLSIFFGKLKMVHGGEKEVILKPYEVDCFDGGDSMQAKKLKGEEALILEPKEGENLLAVYVKTGCVQIEEKIVEAGELFICEEWEDKVKVLGKDTEESGIGICRVRI